MDGRLADAGVLFHSWDGFEAQHQPWMPRAGSFMSASLVYAAQRSHNPSIPTFNGLSKGLILRPAFNRIVCGCESDCGGRCAGAYGATTPAGAPPKWCDPRTMALNREWNGGCVWPPGPTFGVFLLSNARYRRYNEVVLSAEAWRAHLPASVEAIVGDEATHRAFLREFGVSAVDYPLLRLDVSDWERPFRCEKCGAARPLYVLNDG